MPYSTAELEEVEMVWSVWVSLFNLSPEFVFICCPSTLEQVTFSLLIIYSADQIWEQSRFIIIQFTSVKSQQFYAYAMTAWLLCHVQDFVNIISIEFGWQKNKFSVECDL